MHVSRIGNEKLFILNDALVTLYFCGITYEQVDYAKPKAWAGANSLRVSKTTSLKLKSDHTTALPETPLVSFTLNGKRKVPPAKLVEKPTVADKEEGSSHKSITTPSQRVVKRFERPPIQFQHEEKTKATVVPSFTRGTYFSKVYRFWLSHSCLEGIHCLGS